MRSVWAVLVVRLFLTGGGMAQAATYYVATTEGASDANDGRSASPWATLQHAVDSLAPGDTARVGPRQTALSVVCHRQGNGNRSGACRQHEEPGGGSEV